MLGKSVLSIGWKVWPCQRGAFRGGGKPALEVSFLGPCSGLVADDRLHEYKSTGIVVGCCGEGREVSAGA